MNFTITLPNHLKGKRLSILLLLVMMLMCISDIYAVVVTIPTTPGTDTTSFMPTNRRYTFSAARMLYSSSEVGTTGTITHLAFQKDTGLTSTTVNYISIYMRETTSSSLTTAIPSGFPTGYKLVYYSGYLTNTMSSGWTEVTLSTASSDIMTYSGGSNYLDIVVMKVATESAVTSFPNYPVYNCHTTSSTMAAYYHGTVALTSASSFTATSSKRPNIQLTFDNTCAGKPSAGTISGPGSAVCNSASFTMNGLGLSLGKGMKYQWQSRNAGSGASFVNTNVADTFTNLTTSTTNNREYRVYSVCTLSGQSDTSAIFTVNVVPVPTISATGDTTFCAGGSVMLTSTTVSGITYTWYNGSTSTGMTGGNYSATTSGVYKVVASTPACAGVSSNTKTVTVNSLPSASVSALTSTIFCDGGSVVLETPSTSGMTYRWQKGTTDIPGATAHQYTATTTGSYRVVVRNSTTGCSQTSSAIAVTVNPKPAKPVLSTTPSGVTSFCAGSSLTIATPPVSGVTYQWSTSSGLISGATSESYVATVANTYILEATLGPCSTNSDPLTITVNPLPSALITPSGTISFCTGDSLQIQSTPGSGLKYEWKESGVPLPGATGSSYSAKTPGIYKVKVTNVSTGCSDESPTLTINIITPVIPDISTSGPTEFCMGGDVTLNGIIDPGYTTQWQESSADIAGATSSSYNINTSGIYRLKVTNGVGCIAYSDPVEVLVNPLPDNSLSITGGTDICNGESSVIQARVIPGYTYQWMESGSDLPGVTGNPYYAKTPGVYSVEIVDSNGCSAISVDVPVTVKYVSPFYIHPHGNTFFCDGEQTKLTTQHGFVSYQWYFNGVYIPGASDTFVYADKHGKYSVRVQDPVNGCFAESPGFNILVIPAPDTPFITQVGTRLSTSVTDVLYQWFKDGVAIPGATDSFMYTGGVAAVYAVEVTNSNECSKRAELDLSVTGIAGTNLQDMFIKVYPNPARDRVTIQSPVELQVVMYDLQGRLLLQQSTSDVIDMSRYTTGMYLLQFVDENHQVVGSQKISKVE